jgi:hypothetical protein
LKKVEKLRQKRKMQENTILTYTKTNTVDYCHSYDIFFTMKIPEPYNVEVEMEISGVNPKILNIRRTNAFPLYDNNWKKQCVSIEFAELCDQHMRNLETINAEGMKQKIATAFKFWNCEMNK